MAHFQNNYIYVIRYVGDLSQYYLGEQIDNMCVNV